MRSPVLQLAGPGSSESLNSGTPGDALTGNPTSRTLRTGRHSHSSGLAEEKRASSRVVFEGAAQAVPHAVGMICAAPWRFSAQALGRPDRIADADHNDRS